MRRRRAGVSLTLAAFICLSALATGCGDATTDRGTTLLRGTTASFPDHLDPALSQTLEGQGAMWNTYIPLLTYAHRDGEAGTRLIPGLARALPRRSRGGLVYSLRIRPGLHYSDGAPVRASDFRHSVERLLRMNSPGSPFYEDIVGVAGFARTKRGRIAGIQTSDRTDRITIRLRQPDDTFVYALAMPYAAPLPASTPATDLTADPPPATGPYEITSSRPGLGWEYRRNPAWADTNAAAMPQLPGGNFDQIRVDVLHDPETQVNEVEDGRSDWMVNPPPADRVEDLRHGPEGTHLLETPEIDVFYFWMNTRTPPFDDLRVRRAVNYAIDPTALSRIYGGVMEPLQQILPPAMPGHESFVPYPHNLKKARKLIAEADPRQRQVVVWTDDYPPNREAGEYYEDVLRQIGLRPELKVVSATNYFTVIGNRSTPNLDTGWGNWLLDYPNPEDYFGPQLTKEAIRPTANYNYALLAVPRLDARLAILRREPLGRRQKAAYGQLDRAFMRLAPWAPFGTMPQLTLVSSGVDARHVIVSPIFGQDLTSFRRDAH